ncbi:CRISPR-associated helicase Cas3 [Leptospira ryugenii]|uniref:CRISPR-associated helicase Cas3 n=1 Tax=Leptospira ryugenii TaxID=1917863 RepID=A0A2P2E1H9_9LEPT|nr:CRISPR-associated helicase Cas3 [Leptospira ryugenii]
MGEVLLEENPKLLSRFSTLTGIESALFKNLFLFFLAIHDLGKFSDAFQGQVKSIYSKLNPGSTAKNYIIRHDSLGFILWKNKFLINKRGNLNGILLESNFFNLNFIENRKVKDILELFVSITTGHHGKPPSNTGYTGNTVDIYSQFLENNIKESFHFLSDTYHLFLSGSMVEKFTTIDFEDVKGRLTRTSFWLAGLSVLCDWIGSNKEIFEFKSDKISLEKYWNDFAIPRARKAIAIAGVLPCKISKYATPSELFSNIADNLSFSPTPLQAACDSLKIQNEPQLIILEDVTGAGKTEASFILAKRLMETTGSDGLFIGLPTMATANGMYNRVASFYQKLYELNSQASLVLAHGARGLSDIFKDTIISEKIPEDISYAQDEESASASCIAWLADSSKKSTLADVAVGTIDQVLISILLSKFQSLRLFGMMNKVLILDEVHAYDSYMNELIESLLKTQAKIGASVILLTATMPNSLKKKFISAYSNQIIEENSIDVKHPYPLITQVVLNQSPILIPVATREEVKRTVKVELIHEEGEIYKLIQKSIHENKCVCWIRNTVTDAMNSYEMLTSDGNYKKENIVLFHARFAMGDRLDKEQQVLELFGKESNAIKRSGKIVIATQVVEQSLDLDFDIMVTDLAPIDLIIQRAGRLHRHTRDQLGNRVFAKDQREKPVLYVYSPLVNDEPEKNWYSSVFRGGAKVYPDHGKLYLTAKVLKQKGEIKMPEEARTLIDFVYGDKEAIPQSLIEITNENNNIDKQKASQAKNNTINLESGYTAIDNETIWNDINAPTRLGEETIKVSLAKWEEGKLTPWYNKGSYPWANSEVKVMSYILKYEKISEDNDLNKAIDACKENLPDKGKYSILIPLTKNELGNWIGTVLDKQNNEVFVSYNEHIGFRKMKQGEEA